MAGKKISNPLRQRTGALSRRPSGIRQENPAFRVSQVRPLSQQPLRFHISEKIADLAKFKPQRYQASGLNLVSAAFVLWNMVDLDRAANDETMVRR